MIKKFLMAIFILFILGAIFVAFNFRDFHRFPKIISRWYAKEFCSCYFVMERSEDFCRERVRQWIPIQSYSIDQKNKLISATGLWNTAHALYEGDRLGCRLWQTEVVP